MTTTPLHPEAQATLRALIGAWIDFETALRGVPIVARLEDGRLSREDYRRLLRNLRAQVVEGARWITRAASSLDADHVALRAIVIEHAACEHRDYELLETDFVAAGGDLDEIRSATKNLGSEALHAFMMHRASERNPVDMLGAMFVIEGLGQKMARDWADAIERSTGLGPEATRFLRYHGANDEDHMGKLHAMLSAPAVNATTGPTIVRTARIVARLYAMQLEEIDRD